MKKRIFVAVALSALASLLTVSYVLGADQVPDKADAILGKWLTQNKECQVEVAKDGDAFSGKIVWLLEPNDDSGKPELDKHNPDVSKRDRPILGLPLLWGFVYDPQKCQWMKGSIYSPEDGRTYYCSISLDDADTIKVRGSLDKWGLAGSTQRWTHVK